MATTPYTAKNLALEVINDQPDDSNLDDLIRELLVHRMIRQGMEDIEQGRTLTHDQMREEVESWFRSSGQSEPKAG